MIPLLRGLWQLVRSWWLFDRIRVSPREGRLLRIQPGDLLVIDEIEVEVTACVVEEKMSPSNSRWPVEAPIERILRVCSRTPNGGAELRIHFGEDGLLSVMIWHDPENCRLISPDEVTIWPRRRHDMITSVSPDLRQ